MPKKPTKPKASKPSPKSKAKPIPAPKASTKPATARKATPLRRPPRGRGQPTALDEDVQRRICAGLEDGFTLSMAAASVGISAKTAQEWILRGNGNDPLRAQTPLYAAFASAVETAISVGKQKNMRVLMGSRDWRAHAWVLERGHAAEFGRVDRLKAEHSIGGDETKPPIRTAGMTDEELAQLVATLSKHATAPATDEPDPTDPNPEDKET